MEKGKEEALLKELYDLGDKEIFFAVMNYYSKVKTIKSNMVDALDLLDSVAETGDKKDKDRLRKLILDNYNDVPRETRKLIDNLTQLLKE